MAQKKINLVVCMAGLGLGNATRTHAIMEELFSRNALGRVRIFTWGNAFQYFQGSAFPYAQKVELIALKDYLGGGSLYGAGFWRLLPRMVLTYFRNSALIFRNLRAGEKPDLALLDSDFHFLPFLFSRVPVVALSQAPFVVKGMLRLRPLAPGLWARFVFFEVGDALLNLCFAAKVLTPCLRRSEFRIKKIRAIDLIVRKNFLSMPEGGTARGTAMIQSGSSLMTEEMNALAERQGWAFWNGRAGFNLDLAAKPRILPFGLVATQCGLSSLSECIALHKPILAFPMRRHPEQFVNAHSLRELSIAEVVGSAPDKERMKLAERRASGLRPERWPECNGAKHAADEILALRGAYA